MNPGTHDSRAQYLLYQFIDTFKGKLMYVKVIAVNFINSDGERDRAVFRIPILKGGILLSGKYTSAEMNRRILSPARITGNKAIMEWRKKTG